MIYLEFLNGQGLGNQLWCYAALRSLSQTLGYKYKVINPEAFKGKNFLDISYSNYEFMDPNINHYKEIKYNIFKEKLYYDVDLKMFACDFDKEILNIKKNTLIKGLFQSEKYLFNNDINNFIKLKEPYKSNLNVVENQCLLNIRGGEYKRFKNLILPKSYWINAIKNMNKIANNLEFSIVTDDYEYASKLLPDLKIIKGDISEDFYRLSKAKYLIVSNSSFTYFPITINNKPEKIIAPSNWSRFGNLQGRWASPANYYKNWSYQNHNGEIISNDIVKKSIKKTKDFYSTFNILTTKERVTRKNLWNYLPKNFKKAIKKILSKIIPFYF